MALTRLQQISIRQETTEASATAFSSLFAAALTKYLVIDPSLDFTVNVFDRNIKRGTLTPLQGLTGIKTGNCRFSLELSGDTSATAAPVWGLPLQACGFRQESLTKLTIGAITGGPFVHGEVVTQTTSGATGIVVGTTYTGETTLWVAQGNHYGHALGATTITAFTTTAGHVLTGATSGATCTAPTAVAGTLSGTGYSAPAGIGWFPWSYPLSTITTDATGIVASITNGATFYGTTSGAVGQLFLQSGSSTGTTAAETTLYYRPISGTFSSGETIRSLPSGGGSLYATLKAAAQAAQFQIPTLSIGMSKDGVQEAIKASRGTVTLNGSIGEPAFWNFEFQGGLSENSGAASRDNGNVTGITYTSQIPPVLLDADIFHGKSATAYSAEYGPCISSISIALNNEIGFTECMADAAGIQNTQIINRAPTMTVDPYLVAEGTWDFLEQFADNTPSRARFVVGSALQNQFIFKMPGVSWTAVTTGDRNGIATRQLSGVLHSGAQTVSSIASDNELVIIYPIL